MSSTSPRLSPRLSPLMGGRMFRANVKEEDLGHYDELRNVIDKDAAEYVEKLKNVPDKRVLIIYTGGTIGMFRTERGYMPKENMLEVMMKESRSLCDKTFTNFHKGAENWIVTPESVYKKRVWYKIMEYKPLIDSTNMTYDMWLRILRSIEENYEKYDGFIVLHGTDTMAYTASFLSFALENLSKPVILTGAQVPLSEVRNDAFSNLLGALTLAGHFTIPEVCVFFRDRLYRGNRSQKVSSTELDAFDSPRFSPLAEFGIDLKIEWDLVRGGKDLLIDDGKLNVHRNFSDKVALVKIYPMIPIEYVEGILSKEEIKAVILQSYGSGSLPNNRKYLQSALAAAAQRGVVIVAISQCIKGDVNFGQKYEVHSDVEGIVPGADMTIEACTAKLSYLLGKGYSTAEVKRKMTESLRGELTIPKKDDNIFYVGQEDFVISMWNTIFEITKNEPSLKESLLPNLICTAAFYGYKEMLGNMAENGTDIAQGDYDDRTALHVAAREGKSEIISFLLSKNIRPNPVDKFGLTPLLEAIIHGRSTVVKQLVEAGARLNHNVKQDVLARYLFRWVKEGDVDKLRQVYYCGVTNMDQFNNVDKRTLGHLAAAERQNKVVEFLRNEVYFDFSIKDRWGRTPLDEAKALGFSDTASIIESWLA